MSSINTREAVAGDLPQINPIEDWSRSFQRLLKLEASNREQGLETLAQPTTAASPYLEFVHDHKLNESSSTNKRSLASWSGCGAHVQYSTLDDVPAAFQKDLGSGSFAEVEEVEIMRNTIIPSEPPPPYYPSGAPPNGGKVCVARKYIYGSYKRNFKTIMDEVMHMDRMDHRHIIQLVGTHVVGNQLSILMYPAGDSNLRNFLEQSDSFRSHGPDLGDYENSIYSFLICIASAIGYLHGNGMKHMDIKAENMIVQKRMSGAYNIFIADFGLARKFDPEDGSETSRRVTTTTKYQAPEVALQLPRGRSADIFSLGCLYSEMVTVLMKKSLKKFKQVRIVDDPSRSEFYRNIPAVDKWLSQLSQQFSISRLFWLNRILECIRCMTREDANDRPKIKEVYACMAGGLSPLFDVDFLLATGAPCRCDVEMENSALFWD